jgi:GntR family transcriptional regulator/MocR family aminotransferase
VRVAPALLAPAIAVDRRSATPLYRQIYEAYRNAIVERRFRGGQRVPSTRSLAAELGISRIAVLGAFEQLLAEGYFESRPGSGTFVAAALPDDLLRPRRAPSPQTARRPSPRPVAARAEALLSDEPGPWYRGSRPFHPAEPPIDHFPVDVWSKIVARHARSTDPRMLHHAAPRGLPALREAIAEYLGAARAVRCEPDQVFIVGGSQSALDLAARALIDPGNPVWIEEPSYLGVRRALTLAGARPVPVPVDEEGLDVTAGIGRCANARAAFVSPSHQYPLGVTMSASRRLQLLDWAQTCGAWVIEDDYDSEYRFRNLPIGSLQGLDRHSRVIYIGTFTKILFPAIRIGYLVVPADLVRVFTEVRRGTDMSSPTLYQAALADFIREGHFARHIRRIRLVCRQRRTALVEAIGRHLSDELRVVGDDAGMYLTALLLRRTADREIAERAAEQDLGVPPLSACYAESPVPGLILGYGGTPAEEIDAAVAGLRPAIEAAPLHRLRRAAPRSR